MSERVVSEPVEAGVCDEQVDRTHEFDLRNGPDIQNIGGGGEILRCGERIRGIRKRKLLSDVHNHKIGGGGGERGEGEREREEEGESGCVESAHGHVDKMPRR